MTLYIYRDGRTCYAKNPFTKSKTLIVFGLCMDRSDRSVWWVRVEVERGLRCEKLDIKVMFAMVL